MKEKEQSNDGDGEHGMVHRQLGLHERFSVARHNVGAPPILAYGVRLQWLSSEHGGAAFTHAHLAKRVKAALEALPLLSCGVTGAATREPRFASSGKELRVEDVLLPVSPKKMAKPLELLLEEAVDKPAPMLLDLTTGPLWQVRPVETHDGLVVLLVIHHVICDGRGAANLLELLFEGLDNTRTHVNARSGMVVPGDIPMSSDEFVKPSWTYALGAVWNELLVPRLPSFIRYYVQSDLTWPQKIGSSNEGEKLLVLPLKATKKVELLSFPAGTVRSLKYLAESNGVKTLQPVLHTVCALAACAVAQQPGERKQPSATWVSSQTAMCLRSLRRVDYMGFDGPFDYSEGRRSCTGNFVGSIPWQSNITPEDDFWAITRSYAGLIGSDKGKDLGRYGVGILGYLPDSPPSDPVSAETPTGWEAWLRDKSEADQPFDASFEISNLGKIRLPARAGPVEVAWTARPQPIGALFQVDVCGMTWQDEFREEDFDSTMLRRTRPTSDLTICIGWHRGVLSEDGKREDAFVKTVKRSIERLAAMGKAELGASELRVGALMDRYIWSWWEKFITTVNGRVV